MAAQRPSRLSFATPLFDRTRDNSPAPSPTRDRRKNMSISDSTWAVSPSVTLKAFTEGLESPAGANEQDLLKGIANASSAEKELGARVALATKKLKTWCAELDRWKWSGSFDVPQEKESDIQEKSTDHCADNEPAEAPSEGTHVGAKEHWGSLPAAQVLVYGERIDQIKEELEALNMDELKGHILDMHPTDRSRPNANFGDKPTQPVLLDDFSFVVTQTMLQALPYLSMLNQLTGVWSVRLAVLREVPLFLIGLDGARTAMRLGWDALELPQQPQRSSKALSDWKEAVKTIRGVLQDKISTLGQKLDGMLDALEGREDVIPDHWIDDFEALETDYTKWAVEAQRRLFEVDMLMSRPLEKLTRPTSARGADQPFRLSGSQFAKHGLLSAANDFTLQEDMAESPKRSGSVAEMMPSLLHPSHADKGHQRTRSNSEPHLYPPQLHGPRFEPTEVGNGPLIEVSHLSASKQMPGESKQSQHHEEESVAPETPDPAGLKRASVASTQSNARAPVTSQNSSSLSEGQAEGRQAAKPPQEMYDGSLPALSQGGNTDEDEIMSPSRSIDEQSVEVGTPERRYSQEYYPDSSPESSLGGSFEDSPSLRQLPKRLRGRGPPSSLNSTMPKRRAALDRSRVTSGRDNMANFDDYTVFDSSDSPATLSGGLDVPRSNKNRRVSAATEDLEKQIRRIITSVHAPIRLTSGHDSDSSPVDYKPNRNVSGSRPPSSLRVSRTPNAASMTMSPVKSESERSVSSRRSVSHGDSGIKLYHLMQPGRDKPIKLFVRRVGENGERVMVRVGGGWADLGEYLRQYVEHHGKRVVSDGKFEVLGIEASQDWNAARPTSSHSSDSVKGGRPGGLPPAPTSNGSTPGMSPSKSSNGVSRPGSAMTTHTPNGMEDIPEVGASGTSQRSWQGSEVGLAGPNTKRLELSEEKLEWIEGMMEQAKRLGTKGTNRKVLMKH